jgi:AcrR family transcriptional regulator
VPLLSVDRIADETLAMIDSGEPFGVNRLAARLGVSPSSLYNHVAGRDELIELVRGRLADDFAIVVDPGLPWDEAVDYVVRRQRAMFAAHPLVLPLLVGATVTDDRVLAYYGALATALVSAGFPEADVLDIVTVLDEFALGSGLDISSPAQVWRTRDDDSVLGRLLAARGDDAGRPDRAFELGLALIVAGLQSRLVDGRA